MVVGSLGSLTCMYLNVFFFLTHLLLQRASLKGRFRGHSQRNPKAKKDQKGMPTQEIQSWAGYGPGNRLGVVEAPGCWAKSWPKGGRSSSPMIALEGSSESREAA